MMFLVNDKTGTSRLAPGQPVLDLIRGELGLKGTKEGCREGDCGACTVILGERARDADGGFRYRPMPSCLMAAGELEGRHLLTIEGLAAAAMARGLPEGLTPVMRAIVDANGSQCGFCTPGVVMSLSAWLLSGPLDEAGAMVAVEGNLCRCTGYGAILRAARALSSEFAGLPREPLARLAALVDAGVFPRSALGFAEGRALPGAGREPADVGPAARAARGDAKAEDRAVVAGGTDFYVRNPDPDAGFSPRILSLEPAYARIEATAGGLRVGAAVTDEAFFASPVVRSAYPGIEAAESLVASSLVRRRATLGGNVANASPVADLTSILLALGATVVLEGKAGERTLPLERLFLGYKQLALQPGELISRFELPASGARLSFEKVSKRRHLDIASVNSAAAFELEGGGPRPRILRARVSAGGMAAVPSRLPETEAFLQGRTADAATAREACEIAMGETAPIGDVRGSADYRKRLLGRLVLAHFIRLFPEAGIAEELLP